MTQSATESTYDRFYESGGWKYSRLREWWWHRRHLVRRFGIRRGMRMLEVACGIGFHTDLFCRMGMNCVGIDVNETAIHQARQRYPRREFHQIDASGELPFDGESFDVAVTRGCSVYHYDLSAEPAHRVTRNSLRYVKPGGWFVLIIASDLTGRRDAGQIWHNRLDDYSAHFARFDGESTIDWHKGMVICGLRHQPQVVS